MISDQWLIGAGITVGVLIVSAVAVRFINKLILHVADQRQKTFPEAVKRSTRPLVFIATFIALYLVLRAYDVFQGVESVVNGATFVIIALAIGVLLKRVAKFLIHRYFEKQGLGDHTPRLLTNITTLIIGVIVFLTILSHFNIQITPVLATLGVGSLAVGLALQGTLSNFFAGLRIVSEQAIKVGDYVHIHDNGIEGIVEDIGWSTTKIKTIYDNRIVVPNHKFVESHVMNAAAPTNEQTILVDCGVSYESDLHHVEEVALDVARRIHESEEGTVKDYEPFLRFRSFGDSNIEFRVGIRVQQYVSQYKVRSAFIKALKARFDEEGIEISWPIRKIYHAEAQ